MAYNRDTDYQALINEAAARGDFATAARYEQQRNEKIADLNASGTNKWNAQATNNYSQYLPQDPLANNNVFSQVQGGMNMSMPSYNPGNLGSRPVYDGSVINANKPTYENQYAERIDSLLNDILNREKFSYDAETDPMYQQYKTQYKREGNRAMNDTLATVAAGAGGMNSYAMTAAQQANDYYNAQLADKIPELRQLAYSMYMDDLNSQRMDLSMLQSAEQQDYAKYLDSLGQWNSDRNFGYGVHRDQVADWENDRNFGYNQYRDQMGDYQWGEEFGYQKQQDALDREQWQQEFDYMVQQDALDRAAKAYTGGGGEYEPPEDPVENPPKRDWEDWNDTVLGLDGKLHEIDFSVYGGEEDGGEEMTDSDWSKINALNAGPMDAVTLQRIIELGGIGTDKDGSLKWINGWSASNYRQKLSDALKMPSGFGSMVNFNQ